MIQEIVFIDSRVKDADLIIANLSSNSTVVMLNADSDGLAQIAQALAGRTGIDGIHIVSHGAPGEMQLGSTTISAAQLESHREVLAAIGQALTTEGDLLLYGCDVGQGVVGADFVKSIADMTGADVAASTNPTGSSARGGDWVLEYRSGVIQVPTIATPAYAGVLGAGSYITIVDVTASGVQSNSGATRPSISADGRYVVFVGGGNLVSGVTGGVFIKDTQTGSVICASTSLSGVQANNNVNYPSVNANGRYVAFESQASNLGSGDTNGTANDIFVKDLQTGAIICASTDLNGVCGNVQSYFSSISSDGRYVVFTSDANNLVAGDTNGVADVFIKNIQTGAINRISTGLGGIEANGRSISPIQSISADGRYVIFQSQANNLVAGDTNTGSGNVYIKDLSNDTISRVNPRTATDWGAEMASLSSDGRYAVFASLDPNLVPGDTNGKYDVFIKDLQTGTINRASTNSLGAESNNFSYFPSVSTDGRYVVFKSFASNLVEGDTNGVFDVFIKDMLTGTTNCVSRNKDGLLGNGDSPLSYTFGPQISADGKYIVFESAATNLVVGDANYAPDIFRVDTSLLSSLPPLITPPACFTKSTLIATPYGERLVETLAIGDTVSLAHGGNAAVKWIGRQTTPLSSALTDESLPVLIRAGALGENIPSQDLYVSPDHAMLVDDTLIHAHALVNGHSIVQLSTWSGDVEYYHIETERHEIILANGAPAETFVDNETRQRFDNAAEYDALYPKERPMRELHLPRVKFRRQLSRVTAELLQRRAAKVTPYFDRAA